LRSSWMITEMENFRRCGWTNPSMKLKCVRSRKRKRPRIHNSSNFRFET
jgi:uncharacterized protein YjhX (UPF0386 family)